MQTPCQVLRCLCRKHGSIYLNSSWLSDASEDEVHAVLTEELATTDALLNAVDSPGDEGEIFSKLLLKTELNSAEIEVLKTQDDTISINLSGSTLDAEAAAITGTALADNLNGGFGDDVIDGLAGNDTIDGQAGSDVIQGGEGNDVINGNFGNDLLYGDAGDDVITDDQGSNTIHGGSGNDRLISKSLSGDHNLFGDTGNDSLEATGASLNLDGGEGNDDISIWGSLNVGGSRSYVQGGNATANGGSGQDYLSANNYSTAELKGGDDNDNLCQLCP